MGTIPPGGIAGAAISAVAGRGTGSSVAVLRNFAQHTNIEMWNRTLKEMTHEP